MSPARTPTLPTRVFFRTLGCAKNQVDSEVMLGALALGGYAIAEELADADVAIVNTCSFIQSAREESVQEILELADCKERGEIRALVVAGCLPQRYGAELAKELPEVDAFVGTGQFQNIAAILDEARAGRSKGVYVDAGRTHLYDESSPRLLIGARHSAYLKIAEGCDRVCAFCAIPGIRGKFQSRTLESILAEARQLAGQGVREINVISQDTLSWAKDLDGRPRVDELIRALDSVEGLEWVRLLYLYPTALNDAVIDAIAGAKRVLPYIDVPLQHASDRVLRAMKRGVTADRRRLRGALRLRARDALRPGRRVPLLGRGGHLRAVARREGAARGLAQAPPRADEAAARHHAREARRADRRDRDGARRLGLVRLCSWPHLGAGARGRRLRAAARRGAHGRARAGAHHGTARRRSRGRGRRRYGPGACAAHVMTSPLA
jgi:hypothetical protein